MSTLCRTEIEQRLKDPIDDRLVITPLLSSAQIGPMSVDLRLGNQFIVFKMHSAGSYSQHRITRSQLHRLQQRHIVRFGKSFVLHPGTLALAATLEYVRMPRDLEGQVEGRSSWARVGLQIATASSVEPCFRGVVTLELSNVGTVPLVLYPGARLAQLVLRQMTQPVDDGYGESRKYQCSVGPEFSRLDRDADMRAFIDEIPNG